MYQDAGYGQNWQPTTNNARRNDPYTRSFIVLGSLFAIGFFLIVVVVLSLIPLYISHNSSTRINNNNNNTPVLKLSVDNYNLHFQSPYNDFKSETILSQTHNRQTLQAAFTSMIQKDSLMSGSIIEINSTLIKSNNNNKRRQISNLTNIIFNLNIITNQTCLTLTCTNQIQLHAIKLLSNLNQIIPIVRYQESNSTKIYWLYYQLPQTIQSNISYIYVDLKNISTRLDTLLLIDRTQNQILINNNSTSM